jgi:AraC-like DNA-binding protein
LTWSHGRTVSAHDRLSAFFAFSGTTFTEFVLAQRLSMAHRLLNEPRFRSRKITDIAYSVGFNDLSYFNREFRKRFGDTPNAIRRGLAIASAAAGEESSPN